MLQTSGEVSRRMHSDGVCAALCSSYVSVFMGQQTIQMVSPAGTTGNWCVLSDSEA